MFLMLGTSFVNLPELVEQDTFAIIAVNLYSGYPLKDCTESFAL
jgi:hypothetical protein